jgi:hypothetical protein
MMVRMATATAPIAIPAFAAVLRSELDVVAASCCCCDEFDVPCVEDGEDEVADLPAIAVDEFDDAVDAMIPVDELNDDDDVKAVVTAVIVAGIRVLTTPVAVAGNIEVVKPAILKKLAGPASNTWLGSLQQE